MGNFIFIEVLEPKRRCTINGKRFSPVLHFFSCDEFLFKNFHPLGYLYDALTTNIVVQISDFVMKIRTKSAYVFCGQKRRPDKNFLFTKRVVDIKRDTI